MSKKLLYFGAERCSKCRMLKVTIDELKKEYTDVEFIDIDVDKTPELADKYGVLSLPTIVIIKDEHVFARMCGAVAKKIIDMYLME